MHLLPWNATRYNLGMDIFTIGYEGANQAQVIETLEKADIQVLIDVRELPLSRKPGLSKTALGKALHAHGIEYVHLRALGCPKDIRKDFRADKRWDRYTSRYLCHLERHTDALRKLADRAIASNCCLLCFEAKPARCHRSLIADQLQAVANAPLTVKHLNSANPVANRVAWPGPNHLVGVADR